MAQINEKEEEEYIPHPPPYLPSSPYLPPPSHKSNRLQLIL